MSSIMSLAKQSARTGHFFSKGFAFFVRRQRHNIQPSPGPSLSVPSEWKTSWYKPVALSDVSAEGFVCAPAVG
jgi:hypothetical protein